MRKKILSMVLMLVLIPTVAIAGTASEQITVQKNVATVTVNGEKITADNFIYNGTTYVPLRAVSENMGATVDWDNTTKTAKIVNQTANPNENREIGGFLYYMLYKQSAETKSMANAMAVHLLTSQGDMSTPTSIQPLARELYSGLEKSEKEYKTLGGDTYQAYLQVKENALTLTAMAKVCLDGRITSLSKDSDPALDTCEEILDKCDNNNDSINKLFIDYLVK